MPLPRRIYPDPIIDSIVEIRFNPLIDRNAVFGVIYYALREDFPTVDTLPVQQIPESLRAVDPLFAFQPQYRISNDRFRVQVGPDVLSVSVVGAYPGWQTFSEVIKSVFTTVAGLNIVGDVHRLGLRYVSVFEGDLLAGNLKLSVLVPGYEEGGYPTTLRVQLPNDPFLTVLHLTNHASVQQVGTEQVRTGSFIDIDTGFNGTIADFFNQMDYWLNVAHDSEKELFYSLLTDEFLVTLNPEY